MSKNARFLMSLLLFAQLTFSVTVAHAFPLPQTPATQTMARAGQHALNFGSYASFNDSFTQCMASDGHYYWPAIFQTFVQIYYQPCRTQILADIDYLAQHNVRTVRLWPVLSTFAYDNNTHTWGGLNSDIANFDEVLAELAKNHMQAYITLMSLPDCSDLPEITNYLGYYFNPALINDPTTQQHYLQAYQAFIARYKDNSAIYAYDLINEVPFVLANPPSSTSQGYCNLPYDSGNFTKTTSLLTQMYTSAKSIDTQHLFTFSFPRPYAEKPQILKAMRNIVDFYDIHAYSNDPASFYKHFPSYDKPVIHGEVGVLGSYYDKNGNDCEGVGSNYYTNIAPAMPAECQRYWLVNAQEFTRQARKHGIQALFFQLWTASRSYGIRLYDNNNNFTGYQLTTAGQYIMGLSQT